MNGKYFVVSILFFLLLLLSAPGCKHNDSAKGKFSLNTASAKAQTSNFNITILLDLSDRISVSKNPGQAARDTAAIMAVVDALKKSLSVKGTIDSRDRIKVIFYPNNYNPMVQEIASELSVDFDELTPPLRRVKYEQIDSIYRNNLAKLYAMASSATVFNGSDIFNYFKHRLMDDCIISDPGFKNILVILSDGYMYYKNSCYKSENRFSYITPNASHVAVFRNSYNWQEKFDQENYGFIKTNAKLDNLEILALEFAPWGDYASDYDIMYRYWSKWFREMEIKEGNYKIVKTDVPSLNRQIIQNFLLTKK